VNSIDPDLDSQPWLPGTDAVQDIGYTEREAAFLSLVAWHGGHFVSRQFIEFAGASQGSAVMRLIRKGRKNRHLRTTVYLGKTQVHHLYSRPFYEAMGDPDNRNRRRRSPGQIKWRLMCLDYVLANRHVPFLVREEQKVRYFTNLGVWCSLFPRRTYRLNGGKDRTEIYFSDKLPLCLLPDDPPLACFCYVEAGLHHSVGGFSTFLFQYRDLLSEIRRFRIVYAAETERNFGRARRGFSKLLKSLQPGGEPRVDPVTLSLLEFVRLESLYRKQEFSQLTRDEITRLKRARRRFQGEEVNRLLQLFQLEGKKAVVAERDLRGLNHVPPQGEFSTHLLNHSYGFLGSF
jgi:hypothetical protein